ncbi:MAG: single-stranded DNA-binding protein [Planctomycetota bacterium]|nr:MAG: single-stranded DNA-binding protein [Planctomycetota bacterium]
MASFNRVILAGNLTRDPQLSYTPSNTAVCEFGMAVNRKRRDRDGNLKDEVCYVDMVTYGPRAETINKYMTKGRAIMVEGRLRFRQWTNKEGQNRNKIDVVVENFTFIDGGGRAGGNSQVRDMSGQIPADQPSPIDDGPPMDSADIPF